MKIAEFHRLMAYANARKAMSVYQSRPAPSKRSAKSAGKSFNVPLKHSHVVMGGLAVYSSPHKYKALNPDSNLRTMAS